MKLKAKIENLDLIEQDELLVILFSDKFIHYVPRIQSLFLVSVTKKSI